MHSFAFTKSETPILFSWTVFSYPLSLFFFGNNPPHSDIITTIDFICSLKTVQDIFSKQ